MYLFDELGWTLHALARSTCTGLTEYLPGLNAVANAEAFVKRLRILRARDTSLQTTAWMDNDDYPSKLSQVGWVDAGGVGRPAGVGVPTLLRRHRRTHDNPCTRRIARRGRRLADESLRRRGRAPDTEADDRPRERRSRAGRCWSGAPGVSGHRRDRVHMTAVPGPAGPRNTRKR